MKKSCDLLVPFSVHFGEWQKQIYREGTHTAPILECGAFPPLLFFSGRLQNQSGGKAPHSKGLAGHREKLNCPTITW